MLKKIILKMLKKIRVIWYRFLSDQSLKCQFNAPVLARGVGTFNVHESVCFGVEKSPMFFSNYSYLEVRTEKSLISIEKGCVFNNNSTLISEGAEIKIGEKCLFGVNLQILNSDFHSLDPMRRFCGGEVLRGDINIGDNVFVGNNVTILKGVEIGRNSVIANGSLVSKNIPSNVIAGGVPAKVIRNI